MSKNNKEDLLSYLKHRGIEVGEEYLVDAAVKKIAIAEIDNDLLREIESVAARIARLQDLRSLAWNCGRRQEDADQEEVEPE